MSLSAGQRLGPYEIVSPLGSGGMGEVWRARDSRLERAVAVKVLPEAFAKDEQFRQRFEREARTVSQLNHPHICTLHDVGEEGGRHYLVMELLEGESLADRLSRGPLPLHEVLRFGAQVAKALDAAHRSGITHRDLKPGNVMLTKSGAKLLDFGLAKAGPDTPAAISSFTSLPTEARPLTEQGTILGTFQYMAPEQLEGQEADARTDIFALGALLYEMATGQRAFQGASKTSLIAAIVSSQPSPVSAVVPTTPPALDHVIRRCLEKDPEDRWQSALDVASELLWIGEAGSQAGAPMSVTLRRKTRERLAWAAAAVLLATTLGALLWARTLAQPPLRATRTMRASILPPPGTSLSMGKFSGSLALSPDGTRLVFAAADADGRQMLYVRSLESLVAQPLVGSEGAAFPFWSPDGTQIAFFAAGRLLRISAAGGAAFTICPAPDGRGGSWSKDDVIAFSLSTQTGLYRVAAAGGAPTPLTQIEPATRETTHRYPWFLPDGKRFVYLAGSHNLGVRDEVHGVYLSSLEDPAKRRRLVTARSNAQVSQQTLLFTRDQFLMAQRFDPGTIEPVGDPFPVAENVQYERGFFMAAYSVSQNGLLVHRNGAATRAALVLVDEKGKRLRQIADPGDYGQVRVSPDGRRAAVSVADPANLNEDVWIFDLERGTRTRLSFGEGPDRAPVWSPDGRRVAYQSQGSSDIYVRSASGGGSEEVLYQSPALDTPEDWSRDGRFLTFDKVEGNKTDLWILDLEAGKAEALVATAAEEGWGRFSPDGKWLAFLSNESGRFQLYAVRFPNVEDGRWQITTDSAEWLVGWNDAGNALYYLDSESNLVRVGVKAGESFEVGAPERLFGVESELTWANSGDGKSFVVGKSPEGRDQGPMTLVVDWLPEQKAR